MQGRGTSAIGRGRPAERGTALVVALLVMVVMTLLGIPFLLMGETENRIAENECLSLQALYAAESGARVVKRWFDQPGHADNVINPPLAAIDRAQREIDEDGDPATAPTDADGSPEHPYYKQDNDAVFGKPFRGSLVDAILGTEDGPDMRIDAASSAEAETFLRELSNDLLGGYPSGESGRRAKISHIDIYSPPYVQVGGTWKRHGVATVKVVAGVYQERQGDSEVLLSERMVKIVLSEARLTPTAPNLAALNVCGPVEWNEELTIHWGTMAVSAPPGAPYDTDLGDIGTLPVGLPRINPTTLTDLLLDLLWGYDDDDEWDAYYRQILELLGYEIRDPWMRVVSGNAFQDAPTTDQQPWPFTWNVGDEFESGDIPYHPYDGSFDPDPVQSWWDGTHSNYIQNLNDVGIPVECPVLDYTMWKEIALQGGDNVHYFVWDGAEDWFKENGEGDAVRFRELTDGRTGLFFFDTTDGNPPAADGSNLTPPIRLSSGSWGVRGLVYLNAEHFQVRDVTGRATIFQAPGEPFQDKNKNGVWDWDESDIESQEHWLNLVYPDQLDGRFYALNEAPGDRVRDSRGPAIVANALVDGVLYINGAFDMQSDGNFYGSVVATRGVIKGFSIDETPEIYWNAGLLDNWPPGDWGLGTVVISSWETDL